MMNLNQVVLLTKLQREQLVKESLNIIKKKAWYWYHIKLQDMDDFVQACLLYFYNYKDKKYTPGGFSELKMERARYKRFFLGTIEQNLGKIHNEFKKNYISEVYFTPETEEKFVEKDLGLFTKFLRRYSYIEDLADAEIYFSALLKNAREIFGYRVWKKVEGYIHQHRKGKKVSWDKYFKDGVYASMKSTVKRKFRKLCQETAGQIAA
jgi:hypothetical protein